MLYQLSYFRKNRPYQSYPFPHTVSRRRRACNSNRHSFLWEVMDSNHRRRTPADLQSAPFGHSGNFPCFAPLPRGIRFARLSRRNWLVCRPFSFFYPGLTSLRSTCVSRRSSFPFRGGFRSTGARSLLPLQKFLRNLTSEKPCLRQASLRRQSFPSVPLTRFCNFISLPSRRLSEPMEGFEPPTS